MKNKTDFDVSITSHVIPSPFSIIAKTVDRFITLYLTEGLWGILEGFDVDNYSQLLAYLLHKRVHKIYRFKLVFGV